MKAKLNEVAPQLPFNGIIKEGRIGIEPELAARILSETNYDGQRRIDHSQVDTYAEMMRRGLWLQGGQIAFGRLAEVLHLVNGQHRLSAVVAAGEVQEFQVLITECREVDDLRNLYWRFDAVMKPRTLQQILNASGMAGSNHLSKTMTTAVYRAIAFITNDMRSPVTGSGHKTPVENRIIDARLAACEPWWEPARKYESMIAGAQHGLRAKLHAASIVAIALVTIKHQPKLAAEFWEGIARNDGLRKGDPRHTLINWLLTTHDKGSGEGYIAACAAAWNAFYGKRVLTYLRPTTPAKINGTPFDGKPHKAAA